MTNPLEELFALQVKLAGLPEPVREFMAIPGRRYRWDFAWPDQRVLVELNGGTYVSGHVLYSTDGGRSGGNVLDTNLAPVGSGFVCQPPSYGTSSA